MQRVAFLHERDHGIGFAAGRFHRRHRMVAMGVETLALRRADLPDVGALERHPELLQGQLDPVAQRLAAGVFAGERGLQAVDDRQELLGKALQRILLRRRCLCLRALAGVFCVRHRAHHGVALLLQPELKLVSFPSLGAGVGGVTLSERGSGREFVSLESAHASIKLMPLLHGQAVVDAVRVSGLKAQVVKNKDGTYNFSDLLEGGEAKPAAKPAPEKKGESAPVKFDIAGITLDRASILYRDMNSGQEIALTDVKLHTGRIAENVQDKIELAAAAKRNQPLLEAKVALNATYSLKPDAIGLDFTAKLDDSNVKGKLSMARAAQPSYSFDLAIDRINLDRYLAVSDKKKPAAGKQELPKEEEAPQDAPVDQSGLKGLNAHGQMQVGALQVQGLKLSNLKAQLKAADGRAEINPHSASLYEGELSGALSLDGNANRIALKETLANVSIGPLP